MLRRVNFLNASIKKKNGFGALERAGSDNSISLRRALRKSFIWSSGGLRLRLVNFHKTAIESSTCAFGDVDASARHHPGLDRRALPLGHDQGGWTS